MSEQIKNHKDFKLPDSIITRSDIARLVMELEKVDGEMSSSELRSEVTHQDYEQPMMSGQLGDFLEVNGLDINDTHLRSEVLEELREFKNHAPVVHMVFSTQADIESLQRIIQWYRESVNSQVLLTIGLQPSLVAGAQIRTANKVHDLSMRAMISKHHSELVGAIKDLAASNASEGSGE